MVEIALKQNCSVHWLTMKDSNDQSIYASINGRLRTNGLSAIIYKLVDENDIQKEVLQLLW